EGKAAGVTFDHSVPPFGQVVNAPSVAWQRALLASCRAAAVGGTAAAIKIAERAAQKTIPRPNRTACIACVPPFVARRSTYLLHERGAKSRATCHESRAVRDRDPPHG